VKFFAGATEGVDEEEELEEVFEAEPEDVFEGKEEEEEEGEELVSEDEGGVMDAAFHQSLA
jgi:hypothetical protein